MLPWATVIVPEIQTLRLDAPWRKLTFKGRQQIASRGRRHFILHHDVRLKSLPVLWRKFFGEGMRQHRMQAVQFRCGKPVGDSLTKRANARDGDCKRKLRSGDGCKPLVDPGLIRQCVKEGDVRGDEVALRRKMTPAQLIEMRMRRCIKPQSQHISCFRRSRCCKGHRT